MRFKNRLPFLMVLVLLAGLTLSACGDNTATPVPAPATTSAAATTAAANKPGGTGSPVTLRYAMWDNNQVPGYQTCADKFQQLNPNTTIKIEQASWDNYWNTLQVGFVSGNAPDVFVDHVAKYPEFVSKNLILDIQPMVTRDKVDTSIYLGQLADLWLKDGKRFALPKDWDTIAVVYNVDLFKKAGLDPDIMKTWTWNTTDTGTFNEAIAKLTLDANGNNGTSPNFDKKKVVQYGLITSGNGGIAGQIEYSHYVTSNGAALLLDKPFGTHYTYDDPKRVETIQWYADLNLVKGFSPPEADVSSDKHRNVFSAGKGAMVMDGSWTINQYLSDSKFKVGFGLLPLGPQGRKSLMNGLGDSIWKGSKNPDAAWEWVKFLGSPACQDLIGQAGVVFPAVKSSVDKALKARADKGIDVNAFVTEAQDPNGTFLYPISDHGSEIQAIIEPALDTIMLGQAKAADALKAANTQINNLFK